jgi:hypothetical protein
MDLSEDENVASDPGSVKSSFNRKRFSYFKFAECENRMINAIILREYWIDCFFIQSLIWAFATLFKGSHCLKFADMLKKKILKCQQNGDPILIRENLEENLLSNSEELAIPTKKLK